MAGRQNNDRPYFLKR